MTHRSASQKRCSTAARQGRCRPPPIMSIPQLISSRNDPMGVDLPVLWALIIGFGLMMYVVMDGFDLGIGILLPFVRSIEDRDTLVNTGAPVWGGNESWLFLGVAILLAGF